LRWQLTAHWNPPDRTSCRRRSRPFTSRRAIAESRRRAVAALYAELEEHGPTPVVALNRAVAITLAGDVAAELDRLEALVDEPGVAERFATYAPCFAACADLLRRAGRLEIAPEAYRPAIELSEPGPERGFLQRKLAAMAPADVRH
jgi:RNA polymerase sigma-70 factor (ECF subfamily)